jgi:hypothetical protein
MARPLLVGLASGLLVAAGANYVRNAPLDAELANRPYGGLSDADLDAMLSAYESDVARKRAQLESEPVTNEHTDPGQYGAYAEKVAAFERFQRGNNDWKQRRGRVAEQQLTLDGLRHEKSIRQRGLHRPWARMLRRITTL